jgi:Putative zinc dependent peptidase (DUF5700)
MKNIVIIIFLSIGILSCQQNRKKNSETNPLLFNFEQSERFIDLMDYLEAKDSSGFAIEKLSDELISQNFQANSIDVVLNKKIDSLLSLSVYDDFSEITTSYVNDTTYEGREGYRMSFLFFPKTRINMSAGMSDIWATFWEKNNDAKVIQILNTIKREEKQITEKALSTSVELLPEGFNLPVVTEVIFCFDGNRGSFTNDSQIFMEMFDFPSDDFILERFINVLTHELHHIYYGNWFSNQLSTTNMSAKQEALFNYMEPIIFEGIAQQIDHNDKSDQAKYLFNHRPLIEDLFIEMTTSIRKIANSNEPLITFEEENGKIWDKRMDFLKKYLPEGYEDNTISNAPTIVYYIGYQLYNSILQKGGKKRLNFVIENYDCLLEEYNKIHSADLLIPKIPDDIVKLWKNSFKNTTSNKK